MLNYLGLACDLFFYFFIPTDTKPIDNIFANSTKLHLADV